MAGPSGASVADDVACDCGSLRDAAGFGFVLGLDRGHLFNIVDQIVLLNVKLKQDMNCFNTEMSFDARFRATQRQNKSM